MDSSSLVKICSSWTVHPNGPKNPESIYLRQPAMLCQCSYQEFKSTTRAGDCRHCSGNPRPVAAMVKSGRAIDSFTASSIPLEMFFTIIASVSAAGHSIRRMRVPSAISAAGRALSPPAVRYSIICKAREGNVWDGRWSLRA